MKINTIWFDMDGTIADLYGVNDWLEKIRSYDASPYIEAKPLCRLSSLARHLNRLREKGFTIGIISWTSLDSNEKFDREVEDAKRAWLTKHLPSVKFDFIDIVPYGTPKHENRSGILFDDNWDIREEWGITAFPPDLITEILKSF